METKEIIRDFISKNLSIFDDSVSFSDSDNIFELGFVNSLFAVRLLDFVKSEFNIEVSNSEMNIENFSSVNSLANFVNAKNI